MSKNILFKPVRWQVVEGDSPSRTPTHVIGKANASGYHTVCGIKIPNGAWYGPAVDESAPKCQECHRKTASL